MIEFLARDKQLTPEKIVGKFVFGSLPLNADYREKGDATGRSFRDVVGVPTYVTRADAVYCAGNPVKLDSDDNGVYRRIAVVTGESHRREIGTIRVVCDTEEEAMALAGTRRAISEILRTHEGRKSTEAIKEMIDEVYNGVKVQFNPQLSVRDAMMKRVSERLQRHEANNEKPENDDVYVPSAIPSGPRRFG